MAKHSSIEWTDHTFNPWYGCTKVSPGCEHCYAEALMDHRYHKVHWGKGRPRQRTGRAYWKEPVMWNAKEADWDGIETYGGIEIVRHRPRVFCASLADWLDEEVPLEWLADLLRLIFETPHLDWLLLTKRPENWGQRIGEAMCHFDKGIPRAHSLHEAMSDLAKFRRRPVALWLGGWLEALMPERGLAEIPHNIWIGTTVEDQTRADQRIPELLKIPARVRFLSCEPLLGLVRFPSSVFRGTAEHGITEHEPTSGIHWVIAGGESGPEARPMHPDWARSLRDQCAAADVPFFFKQWGEWVAPRTASENEIEKPTGWLKEDGNWLTQEMDEDEFAQHNCEWMVRRGKKAAGRLLDGVEHNAFPTVERLQEISEKDSIAEGVGREVRNKAAAREK